MLAYFSSSTSVTSQVHPSSSAKTSAYIRLLAKRWKENRVGGGGKEQKRTYLDELPFSSFLSVEVQRRKTVSVTA
jgi:hypothetical protein